MTPNNSRRKTPPKPILSAEAILAEHPPEIRQLAERLRGLIRATIPEAVERPYPGWHAIGYRHPQQGYIGAIFPEPGRARLAFEWGALLPDPHRLLGGSGKQVRYLDITKDEEIQEDAIRELLLAAVSLPGDRAFKLELIRQSAKPSTTQRPTK